MEINKVARAQQAVKLYGEHSVMSVDILSAQVIIEKDKAGDDTITYMGYCAPGVTEAEAAWMIKKITETDVSGGVRTRTQWAKNTTTGERQAADLVFDSGSAEYEDYTYEN